MRERKVPSGWIWEILLKGESNGCAYMFDVGCERQEASEVTKHFGLSQMGLSFIEIGRSKEETGLRMDQEFNLGHSDFEMSLNNQRRYQAGNCIYVSRI